MKAGRSEPLRHIRDRRGAYYNERKCLVKAGSNLTLLSVMRLTYVNSGDGTQEYQRESQSQHRRLFSYCPLPEKQ